MLPARWRDEALRSAVLNNSGRMMPIRDRFWSHVLKTDGCWTWTARKSPSGYGHFSVPSGKTRGICVMAHRASYVISFGAIPDGNVVCHTCDNPSCVRPDHLFVGTFSDNTRDAIAKGRMSPKTPPPQPHLEHCKRGHAMTVENTHIPVDRPTLRRCRACDLFRHHRRMDAIHGAGRLRVTKSIFAEYEARELAIVAESQPKPSIPAAEIDDGAFVKGHFFASESER